MQYIGLFVWFSLCLLLGSLVQSVMAGAARYRIVAALMLPGVMVRKLAQAAAALVCGARVTGCSLYEPTPRDIQFRCGNVSSGAKVLVPLAPLFGCIFAFVLLSGALNSPLSLQYPPPSIPSLDLQGVEAFAADTGAMVSGLLKSLGQSASTGGYLMILLAFSLALGPCQPLERLKKAIVGVAAVVAALALLEGLAAGIRLPESVLYLLGIDGLRAAFVSLRRGLVDWAGRGLALIALGLGLSLIVGLLVRIYELATGREKGSGSAAPAGEGAPQRAA
ncbi:MAG: hypothetical protein V5A84_04695 [Planctomycetota bacterium]